MEILKELFFGNISEVNRVRKSTNQNMREKEGVLYDTIKNKLPKGDDKLLDDFLDILWARIEEDLIDKYIQGIKTGILIGLEVNNIDLS